MPTRYRLVLDGPAQEVLLDLAAREQRALRDFLRTLADHPFRRGAQHVLDANGRRNEVESFGRVIVTYWADHAAAELRIAALEFC
jgi:hypothetical protein